MGVETVNVYVVNMHLAVK